MALIGRSSYGKPRLPIKRKYILAALDLLVSSALVLQTSHKVKPTMLENPITFLLDYEMKQLQRTGTSDVIWWDTLVNTQDDPNDPFSRGEIDIKFRWAQYPSDNDRYLAVEAKRLFGRRSSRADDYVDKGVMDFINAKYARSHNYGIMLGYILVGPLTKAVSAVNKAMNKRKVQTEEYSAFTPDVSLCSHPYTHHSIHIQKGTVTLITLIHIFLDFST